VAVYVDDMYAKFRRMKMCHMTADTEEELHAMAKKIGMKRAWHQSGENHSVSHYDVGMGLRAHAVRNGAIEITLRQLAKWDMARTKAGNDGEPFTRKPNEF